MRLNLHKREPGRYELYLIPMIDVVIVILVFLLCSASLVKSEKHLPSRMLEPGKGRPNQIQIPPVQVYLKAKGPNVLVTVGGNPCANFETLTVQLRRLSQEARDLKVIIQGDGDVPFDYMVAALDSCYQAGLTNVAYSPKGVQ